MPPVPPGPRRRGRPPKVRPVEPAAEAALDTTPAPDLPDPASSGSALPEAAGPEAAEPEPAAPDAVVRRTRGRPRAAGRPAAGERPVRRTEPPSIEAIVAVEAPREFRLHPRERIVAFTAEAAGARQLFTMPLRGDAPTQVTASEKAVSDPQWSPDARRLAFVRDGSIVVVEVDGSRQTTVAEHPAGNLQPRWSPDGRRIAFLSRRRGWSQIWLVDAPIPRRGRPPRTPRPPEPVPVTPIGVDVEQYAWSPDGARIAYGALRPSDVEFLQLTVVDLATGEERRVDGDGAWETGVSWARDGSLLFLSDADGWFQVMRLDPALRERMRLTADPRDHGEPTGSAGYVPLASPDGSRVAYLEIHDGCADVLVGPLGPAAPVRRGPGRPPKVPRVATAATAGTRLGPWPGLWRIVDWLHDGSAVLAAGESEGRPADLWVLPVPGVAAAGARPRQVTRSLPTVLEPAFGDRSIPAERVAIAAWDGLRLEGTLYRPAMATGRRGGTRVPAIVHLHGGPTWQAYRRWDPFTQLLVREGIAVLDLDFRGSTGYGRAFRLANRDEWGHADVHDVVDAGRWLADQPWCDGRLAVWGGSYGGYLVLGALVEEPGLWAAGVDLYGDSEIAESYRHGDRVGRLDLERQMGRPDDPDKAELYRRGSPVYRAERLEAPLLIFHGRRDKRVVPLMTERMVEALEIEGKHHEVVWYLDEAHGWERRENRRDYYQRTLAFLRRHLLGTAGG